MWRKEWIDSDAYQEGVMQRIRKKQLVKFCRKEVVIVAQKIDQYEREAEEANKSRESVDDKLTKFADNLVAFQTEARQVRETYEEAKAEKAREQLEQSDTADLKKRQQDAAAEMVCSADIWSMLKAYLCLPYWLEYRVFAERRSDMPK